MRAREIIKIGGSYHVRLYTNDLVDLDLEGGDFVDIEDLVKVDSN